MTNPRQRAAGQPATGAKGGSISDTAAFERALWGLVGRLCHRAVVARTVDSTGYTLPASCWALLGHLQDGGPMRVGDIAACHGVEPSSVTPRLQMLEAEGLVVRHRDPRDRRASVIAIGPAGYEALQGLHRSRQDLLSHALTPDDLAQLPRVTTVLERISQSLQAALDAVPADQKKEAER